MTRPAPRPGLSFLVLALVTACLAGCSGQSVQGTVTLDGNPVDGGVIRFTPKEGADKSAAVGGPIVAGKYKLTGAKAPPAGAYRVDINWPKPTGRKIPTPGDPDVPKDETVEAVPPAYNSASTLSADLTSGSNTVDFDLKAQGYQPQQQPGRTPAKGD